MSSFWEKLPKPFYALAPMAGVTDGPFRRVCASFGADVFYSEMVSATALVYDSAKTLDLMRFTEIERPFVIQLFGAEPEHFAHAARFITETIRPDGIDINFGCPVPKVAKQGAGALLMQDLSRARNVIEAVLANTDLPVSIKTRTQSGRVTINEFLDYISDLPLSALMLHGRTLAQGFAGQADAEAIRHARQHFSGVLIANGGVKDRDSAHELLKISGADGLGLARGTYGRPYVFAEIKDHEFAFQDISLPKLILSHARDFVAEKGEGALPEFRKHLAWYVGGRHNASELRRIAVQISSMDDIERFTHTLEV